jgi:hypothetical protein
MSPTNCEILFIHCFKVWLFCVDELNVGIRKRARIIDGYPGFVEYDLTPQFSNIRKTVLALETRCDILPIAICLCEKGQLLHVDGTI